MVFRHSKNDIQNLFVYKPEIGLAESQFEPGYVGDKPVGYSDYQLFYKR